MEVEIPIPSRRIRLKIRGSGKVSPKKYGPNVFKVGAQEAYLLQSRGWSVVNRTRDFILVRTEGSDKDGLPTIIDVDVPTPEQVMGLARRLHEAGVAWKGTVGEWGAWYSPAKQQERIEFNPLTKVQNNTTFSVIDARLQVGSVGFWDSSVSWEAGHPKHSEDKTNVVEEVSRQRNLFAEELIPGTFREGAAEQVLVNRFERDQEARRMCIEHFGPICAACDLDFGQRYGKLASGFIHVHHKTPLSEIGEEYEVDPINDLIPVCPNCHAVIHMNDPPYSVEEVREMLRHSQSARQLF